MADNTLIINIAGSADDFLKELDKVKDKTKSLEKVLSATAKASALAFAGFTAAIALVTKSFIDYEKALVGVGKTAKITGNTGTVLNFADIGVTLDNTSEYEILDDLVLVYVDTVNSKIKLILEETTDQAISAASGNSVNIGVGQFKIPLPVNMVQ